MHTPLNCISFAIQWSCLRILSFASAVAWDTSPKWVRMSWCVRSFKTGMDEASSYSEKTLCSLLTDWEQTMAESNPTPENEQNIRMTVNNRQQKKKERKKKKGGGIIIAIVIRWHVHFEKVSENM